MLQKVVDYYKRYKRPILVVGGVVSCVYLTTYYAKKKFFQFQERSAKDRAAKENLRRRFDQNQVDAMYTISALVQVLNEQILSEYKLEELVERIGNLKNKGIVTNTEDSKINGQSKPTKIQLWEELKTLTFTRTLGSIYLVELLGLLGHIQMNLLGRMIYIDSIVGSHNSSEESDIDSSDFMFDDFRNDKTSDKVSIENERLYLSFSWWFINRGWKGIMSTIQEVIKENVGKISLKQKFNHNEVILLFASLRSEIDKRIFEDSDNFLGFMFPVSKAEENEVLFASGALSDLKGGGPSLNKELRLLIDETKDFIECPDFTLVRNKALDSMMELLFLDLKEKISPGTDIKNIKVIPEDTIVTPGASILSPINEQLVSQPLAKLLPILAQLGAPALRSTSNPYLSELAQCKELQAFSAIIYSSFEILN